MRGILFLFLAMSIGRSLGQVFEAESGTRTGTVLSTSRAGYSGTGYVTGFDADNDKVAINVSSSPGIYKVYVRYASPSGDKWNFVKVNGQNLGSVAFPSTSSFKEALLGKVWLKEGTNVVEIVKDWGYFDVDQVRFEPTTPFDFNQVAAKLVTPLPSKRADSLYQFLRKAYGKVILSGQYGGATEFQRIRNVSGKTPVIRGFDLIDYSPSRVQRGSTSTEVEKAIEWDRQKGITTFCWHWNAPKDLIDQPGKEWWRGFYTDATNFDVTKAMNNQASEEYTLLIRDIDAIAVQLKRLKAANVPVLWRPLHEAEGRWFWWGTKGPEACKWLWKLLYDRLLNEHKLDNLIWVWTSTGDATATQWYPGDEYVDVIGADIYLPAGNYSNSFVMFDNMATLYAGRKIIAMSENGTIPNADLLFEEFAAWSFFATWSGNFITDGQSNSDVHIAVTYNHEYVITLEEIDKIDEIIAAIEKKREVVLPPVVMAIDDEENLSIWVENPFTGSLLAIHGVGLSTASLFDLCGRRLRYQLAGSPGSHLIEMDCSGLSDGLYIVKVEGSREAKTFRVLKR